MGSFRSFAMATATPPLAVPSSFVSTIPLTPAAPMNSRACVRPFCPTVASRTNNTSCGAPATSRAATRRIFSSSFIRLTRVWSRPAVRFHRLDDPARRGDADVGRDEELLEHVGRLDVDRTRAPLGLVGDTDDLLEPLGDLLLGA